MAKLTKADRIQQIEKELVELENSIKVKNLNGKIRKLNEKE